MELDYIALCDDCHKRPGKIIVDTMMPTQRRFGIMEPWRFVYRRCQWCQAIETKRNKRKRN